MYRRDSRRERKLVTAIIISSIFIVAFAIVATFYFSPENNATRELERLAKEYYETYLYGSSLSTFDNGREGFAEFADEGFRPVKLRQLLLYNGGKNRSSQRFFETDSYKCNLDDTKIIYRPTSPYGPTDYTIEYKTTCKTITK